MTNALRYAFLNQLWRVISGPLILLLIPLYLSPITQGLWFSIISLAALVILADLGFSTIVTQFTAHEFAHLRLTPSGSIEGSQEYINRLSSLFHFCLAQIKRVTLFVFPVILLINFLILSHSTNLNEWLIPWILYNLASIILFSNNIILAFIEGCNQVALSQKIRIRTAITNALITMLLLFAHANLYALAIAALISAILTSFLIARNFGSTIQSFSTIDNYYPWGKEVYPLLSRYAGSFISGYFIFQVFTPLALTYYGPIEAGKVGLSIALWVALLSISNVWLVVLTPKINMLVAHQQYSTLNPLFRQALGRAGLTYLGGLAGFLLLYLIAGKHFFLFERTVSITAIMLLASGWFFQVIIHSMAIYIRAHKEEPLLIPSVLMAVYIAITTLLAALFLPFEYFFIGFLSSYLWALPWIYIIFHQYYHKRAI